MNRPRPKFQIAESAGAGYQTVWAERQYLIRLAVVPLLIKFVCLSTATALGWEMNFIRQGLVMLPAFFAEGWLCAHLVRLVFLDQRWPFRPTGNPATDMPVLQDRALGVMRGTLTFVVIKFLMCGFMAGFYDFSEKNAASLEGEDPDIAMMFLVMAFLAFAIWAFRLLWLYIPAAVNYPLRKFLRDLGGYNASFYLMGAWFLCFVPFFFGFHMVYSAMVPLSETGASAQLLFFMNLLRVFVDTVITIVSTVGIAWGVREYVMPGYKKNRKRD